MANAATYFVDRHVRENRGETVAFREAGAGRTLTYGALADQSGRVAAALRAHGVRKEERMAMLVLDQIAVNGGAILGHGSGGVVLSRAA